MQGYFSPYHLRYDAAPVSCHVAGAERVNCSGFVSIEAKWCQAQCEGQRLLERCVAIAEHATAKLEYEAKSTGILVCVSSSHGCNDRDLRRKAGDYLEFVLNCRLMN